MNPAWLNTLEKLARDGFLASSAIPVRIRTEWERWGERSGCFTLERQGRGSIYRVIQPAILESEIQKIRPLNAPDTLHGRASNLARFRDTKTGESRLDYTYLIAKVIGNDITAQIAEKPVSISAHSLALGCMAIPLQNQTQPWHCEAPLLLVENQALLDHTHWLPENWCGILLYYQGQLSERLLTWLSASRFGSMTLFPDYDGIGLGNFVRLRQVVSSAQWYWGKDWENALTQFGNPSLWQKDEQRKQMETVFTQWENTGYPDPQFQPLLQRMRQEGKMLEQEWVLIASGGQVQCNK